ncbi:hypothetical protein QE152_g109 [Popillia japonica]|uniref:Uncharacterized protein n=1 Tax=Popillia japonica TaxID=7064 RepID=A0AAW1NL12_POPJA
MSRKTSLCIKHIDIGKLKIADCLFELNADVVTFKLVQHRIVLDKQLILAKWFTTPPLAFDHRIFGPPLSTTTTTLTMIIILLIDIYQDLSTQALQLLDRRFFYPDYFNDEAQTWTKNYNM